MDHVIEVSRVEKTYRPLLGRAHKALQGVDLEVRKGEVFGLIGPNGAGKTTLMTCLLGFQRPDRGTIRVNGRPPDDLSVRERTGYLPERLGFDRDLTGRQFLRLHARLAGLPRHEAGERVEKEAADVDLAPEALGRPLRTYSRGMLQRIGFAQALLGRPSLLFLDEPASGLDPHSVLVMRHQILAARQRGATVVLNSHQLPEVERLCDRVAFIQHGRVERVEALQASPEVRRAWTVQVQAGQEESALSALVRAGLAARPVDGALRVDATDEEAARIAVTLVSGGLAMIGLSPAGPQLEQLFRREGGPMRAARPPGA